MTPTTEAGKAHAEAWIDAVDIEWGLEPADRETMLGEVAAIEVEAVAVALSALRERVAGMEGQCHDGEGLGCDTHPCMENVSRAAVLAEFDRLMMAVTRLARAEET